jgi:glutaminyl-tRNA synthetase
LFTVEQPGALEEGEDFLDYLNPASLEVIEDAQLEPSLANAEPGSACQFERLGYFNVDSDSSAERLVMNRTVTLRDTWAKLAKKEKR